MPGLTSRVPVVSRSEAHSQGKGSGAERGDRAGHGRVQDQEVCNCSLSRGPVPSGNRAGPGHGGLDLPREDQELVRALALSQDLLFEVLA